MRQRHGMRFVNLRVELLEERRQPSHSLPDAVLLDDANHGDDIAIAVSRRQDDSPSAGSSLDVENEHGHSYQEYDESREDSSSGDSHGPHGDDGHGGGNGNELHAPEPLSSEDANAGSLDDHGHGAANHGEDHGNAVGHADNGNHGVESGDQAQASPPSTPAASETRTVVYIIIPITPAASAAPGRQVHYQPKAVTRDDGEGDDPEIGRAHV